MEATLTRDPKDRRRALAMAYYLDPRSLHLESFKKAEIEQAVQEFGPSICRGPVKVGM